MSKQDLPPKMTAILEELPGNVSATLLSCLADKDDTAQRIHEALTANGVEVGYTSVKQARKAMIA